MDTHVVDKHAIYVQSFRVAPLGGGVQLTVSMSKVKEAEEPRGAAVLCNCSL